jgi:hypothetical protein
LRLLASILSLLPASLPASWLIASRTMGPHNVVALCALIVCTLAVFSMADYSDSLARNKMMPLSAAAYSNHPEQCLANAFTNAKLVRFVSVECDIDITKNDICAGYSAVSHGDRAIIFAFRGTEGFMQLMIESDKTVLASKTQFPIGGKVSAYFDNVFQLLWVKGLAQDLATLQKLYPTYQLWITGHSLGGAVAALVAANIVEQKLSDPTNIHLYTFGQPRTGDKPFADAHDALLPNSFRVTHARDIVPHVPPEGFEGYRHHRDEVWYNNDMKIGQHSVFCDSEESTACSDRNLFDLSIGDHLHYFNTDVSAFGSNGCKSA